MKQWFVEFPVHVAVVANHRSPHLFSDLKRYALLQIILEILCPWKIPIAVYADEGEELLHPLFDLLFVKIFLTFGKIRLNKINTYKVLTWILSFVISSLIFHSLYAWGNSADFGSFDSSYSI
jgi:hypothetical protein